MRDANQEEEESDHQCGTDADCVDQGPYMKCGCAGDDCGICLEAGETRSETQGKKDIHI